MFSQCYEGTSLIWYGSIPGELSGTSTTATWVIDDNPARNFTLKGHEVNAASVYNQKFFETPVYPFGPHKLTVTYNGDNSKTPLVLGKLVIRNDTAVSFPTSTPTSTPTTTPTTSGHSPAIIGGVIGGVACMVAGLLIGSLVLFVLYRRRRLCRQKEMKIKAESAYVLSPRAIPYDPPDSHELDSTSRVAGPSSLVVHQDSRVGLPQMMPPAYTT